MKTNKLYKSKKNLFLWSYFSLVGGLVVSLGVANYILYKQNQSKTFVDWSKLKASQGDNLVFFVNEVMIDQYNSTLKSIFPNASLYNQNTKTPFNWLLPRFIDENTNNLNDQLRLLISENVNTNELDVNSYNDQLILINNYLSNYTNNIEETFFNLFNKFDYREVLVKFELIKTLEIWSLFLKQAEIDNRVNQTAQLATIQQSLFELRNNIKQKKNEVNKTYHTLLKNTNNKEDFERILNLNPLYKNKIRTYNLDELFKNRAQVDNNIQDIEI